MTTGSSGLGTKRLAPLNRDTGRQSVTNQDWSNVGELLAAIPTVVTLAHPEHSSFGQVSRGGRTM